MTNKQIVYDISVFVHALKKNQVFFFFSVFVNDHLVAFSKRNLFCCCSLKAETGAHDIHYE